MPRKLTRKRARMPRPFGHDEAVEQMLERLGAGVGTKARARADRKAEKALARVLAKGGTLEALDAEVDRQTRRWEAKRAGGDLHAPHRAATAPNRASTRATRPARATLPLGPAEESPRTVRKRRRASAGFAGYVDPRLFDGDEWDE